jgi:hypothetical protein
VREGACWIVFFQVALHDADPHSCCRRPSAVVNPNCVTNRVAQGPRYTLSWAMLQEQYNNIHTLLDIPYLQTPHPTVRQVASMKISAKIPSLIEHITNR